jgi:hypothetical protein
MHNRTHINKLHINKSLFPEQSDFSIGISTENADYKLTSNETVWLQERDIYKNATSTVLLSFNRKQDMLQARLLMV